MSKAVLSEQIFKFVWDKDSYRSAEITFIKGKDKWVFSKCVFDITSKFYSVDDWGFLNELSQEILRLNEEITKPRTGA